MQIKTSYLPTLFGFALGALAMHACATPLAGLADMQPVRTEAMPDALRRLDAIVPRLLAEKRIASVSVARIEDGRLSFVAAWGEASPGVPATPGTLYNIASM